MSSYRPEITRLGDMAALYASETPDKIAFICDDRQQTYAQYDAHCNQVANKLTEMGAKAQGRIGYIGKNSDYYFELLLGGNKANQVMVPVNWRLAPPEVAGFHRTAQVLADEERVPLAGTRQGVLEGRPGVLRPHRPGTPVAVHSDRPGLGVVAAGVGVAMFASPINKFMNIDSLPLIIGGGIAMTYTVTVGFKAIERLSKIAVPAIIILGVTSVTKAISDTSGGVDTLLNMAPTAPLTFAVGIALAVGSFISGATLTPDFVRFAKNKTVGIAATIIGFTFGNSLMFIFGAAGAAATGLPDIAEVLAVQGLLGAGIVLLALNIWTTNDNALYAASLGLRNITGLKRVHLVIAAGLTGTLLAEFLYHNFVSWLVFLSVSLPPIGGIIIGDFYLRCHTNYPLTDKHQFKEINWAAMLAWGLAIGVSAVSPEDGPLSIAPLNAIIAAAVSYAVLYKLIYASESNHPA